MNNLHAAWQIAWSTLRRRRGSLLTFAGVAAMFHFITAVGLQMVGGLDGVQSMLESYSPNIRQLLKISPALQADYSLRDHLAFTWLHPFFIGLCAAFVVGRSSDALAGDIESGAVYLVLSRPVPRWALVLGRIGEVGLGLAVILLMSWLALSIGVQIADLGPLPVAPYAVLVVTAWCLFMALSAVALIVSSVASRAGVAAALGTIWTLATYVLDVLPAAVNSPLAWLNPWHHYFPPGIVAAESIGWFGLMILVAWATAATIVAMALFGRRDLV
ncbi:MAG: ABC transporter permease subunit [Gammaproteobacteria bacterium]|nr:ABC transporter permease subunit [Gammaproteobacteria bacterium]